jgi:L-threonine kinase
LPGAPPAHPGIGCASAPGTCGELVQGLLAGTFFHVTCPVDLYARVEVRLTPCGGVRGAPDCPKAREAVRRTLAHFGREGPGAELRVDSPLPRGKGMASSTADIVAAVGAAARALGEGVDAGLAARIALAVEPSDGIMFPGIAVFDHRHGKLAEWLGLPPPMAVLALDFGGTVDTLEFNRVDRTRLLEENGPRTARALELVREGIRLGDPRRVGRAATWSAQANQRILFKPQLDAVLDIARARGAAGINVGHSGTVIGVLLDARRPAAEPAGRILDDLRAAGLAPERHWLLRLVSGGFLPASGPPPA